MTQTVEGYILMDSGPQYPPFDRFVGATRRVDVGEDMLGVLAALAHEFGGLRRDVEIFLSAGLLLFEDNPSELSLLMHIAPCQTDHVGAAQSRQAGEQERPLDGRIFAFCLSEPLHLFDGQVHACSLFGLETLDAPHGVDRYDAILVCLIQAGPQFIEVADP